MQIIKKTINSIKGYSFIDERGNEFFITINEEMFGASDEEARINEAVRLYEREKFFLIHENAEILKQETNNIEYEIGSKEYIEAVEQIKTNLYGY